MSQLPTTAGYWLLQAAAAKEAAEGMSDPSCRRTMLLIARGYERMAEHAARLERTDLPMERAKVDLGDA